MADGPASDTTGTDPTAARSSTAEWPPPPSGSTAAHLGLRRGDRIARYVVLDEIGAGGMGVVLRAFDPDLERLVAVKLFRGGGRPFDDEAGAQLLREGRALARLAHPNVVAVHDVGAFGGELFVAMEYVDGQSLREWLVPGRSRRAILDAFVAAGQGLAAAHEAGVIHRDFKPSNVIVGRDGRVRVVDFGLALRATGALTPHTTTDTTPNTATGTPSLTPDLPATAESTSGTARPAAAGSPPYMPPEQHDGGSIDVRADQFAFCAALFEALVGVSAFRGDTPDELARDKRDPSRQLAGRARSLPRALVKVLERGLAAEPSARFPSLNALLSALARARSRPARLGANVGLGLALVAVVATTAVLVRRDPAAICGDPRAPLAGAWNADVAHAIGRAFAATKLPYAADAAAQVTRRLDRWTDDWARGRADACAATRVRHEQSDALMDLRMRCLSERKEALAALTTRLAHVSERAAVRSSIAALDALPPPAACGDREALLAALPPPANAATAAAVDRLRSALAENAALDALGAHKEARARAEELVKQAAATGYAPAHAEALDQLVHVLGALGAAEPRETAARELLQVAAHAHDDHLMAVAQRELVAVIGETEERYDEALAVARVADAAVERAGAAPSLHAGLLVSRAMVLYRKGQLADARAQLEEAERLYVEANGEQDLMVARTRNSLAIVVKAMGDRERGIDLLTRSLATKEALLGPHHPDLAPTLSNLGNALRLFDRYDEAVAAYQRALTILGESDPNVPLVNDVLVNLANCLVERGEVAAGRARYLEALRRDEEHFGADHPRTAITLVGLSDVEIKMGQFHEAELGLRRALAIREHAKLGQHTDTANVLMNLSVTEAAQGRAADAERTIQRALAIVDDVPTARPQPLSKILLTYGKLCVDQHRFAEGEALYERAVALWPKGESGELSAEHANALESLAELDLLRGRFDGARARYAVIEQAYERIFGRDNVDVSFALVGLGTADLRAGRASRALPALERAVTLQRGKRVRADYRADGELALAQALWATGGDRARALALAEHAVADYATVATPEVARRAAEARRWLERTTPRP